MRTILDLCEDAVCRPGMWVYKSWWEQDGFEMEGVHAVEEEEAGG